jgi:uncharacterized RDD family membrane protein YckC
MARAIGGWLSGPPIPAGDPPGVRLGFPAQGPGSMASTGSRVGAFIVDAIVANLLAGVPYLFGARYTLDSRNIAVYGAFLLVELIFDSVYGQTLGKRLFNIRVIRVDGDGLASFRWILLRTALLATLIPAVVWDRDRRGLHDKASGTVVVVDPNKAQSAKSQPARSTSAKSQPVKEGVAPAPGPARQPKKTPANASRRKKRR